MGISSERKKQWQDLPIEDQSRIVRMAWEDRTSFEAIRDQYGLTPNDTVRFMRTQLDNRDFKRWRRRANNQGHLKQRALRGSCGERFKCSRQRLDGSTKGWK